MTARIGRWAFVICIALSLAFYLLWTIISESPSATNARLHPVQALGAIVAQLGRTAPLPDWNIPWWSIVVWMLWIIGIQGTGALASRLLHVTRWKNAATGWVADFGTGFVIYALVQLLTGLLGFARIPLIYPFFLLGMSAAVFPSSRASLIQMPMAVTWQWQQLGRGSKTGIIFFLALTALLLVPAFTPPLQSDGLRYHLGAVQEFLKNGRISYLPLNAYSNMPFLVEMHFMGVLACKAPEASHLIHLTLGGYTALTLYCLVMRLSPDPAREGAGRILYLLPALLYICTPMSAVLATWPFTDHGMAFYLSVAVLVALCITDSKPHRGNWVMLGILTGGLIGTKYTMGPVAVLIMVIPWITAGVHFRPSAGVSMTGLMVMGVVGGVWYLKNLIYTGNPFYPLGSSIFPGGEWTAVNDAFLQTRAGAKGMGKGVTEALLLPYYSTFNWVRFESHHPGATVLFSTFGVLFGFLSTGIAILDRERRVVAGLMLATLITWFFSYQSNRLLLPTIALALALTPVYLVTAKRVARSMFCVVMTITSAAGIAWAVQWSWLATALTPPPLPYLLGAQDESTFRNQSITYGRAFDFLNEKVGADEKVLLIGEHRIFGARFHAIWSDWFDRPALVDLLRRQKIQETDALINYLKASNINWILINEAELAPQLERDFRPWFGPGEWTVFESLRDLEIPGVQTYHFAPGVTVHNLRAAK